MNRSPIEVLIIEDSPEDLDFYKRILGQQRDRTYTISSSETGEEGLVLCRERRPQVIILDFNLPDLDGVEFLERLRREVPGPSIAAVMLTGQGNEAIAVGAMKAGAQDYLVKGLITSDSLRVALDHAIEKNSLGIKLAEKQLELERSNRELEQYARVVAHDLKTPLFAISGYLDLFKDQMSGRLAPEELNPIDSALACARRMDALIKDILAYSRLGGEKNVLEPVEMEVIFSRALDNLREEIRQKNASISYGKLPGLFGNPMQLLQLVQNLLSNALKFCQRAQPIIKIGAERVHGEWLFTIEDNGIGIEGKDTQRIFLAFERAHNKSDFPGTGLGLAICKKIVELHRGVIWVESEPGLGSRFRFTLPAIEEP